MAEQLGPLHPSRVLDIGCGTGEGLVALLSAFSPTIISLEENANCIQRAYDAVSGAGFPVEAIVRLGYHEFRDGTHEMSFNQDPIVASKQVSLIHADTLVDDPAMNSFISQIQPVDAVTVWLIGTYMMRRTCRNIASLRIADSNEYRLHVQNRIYLLADKVLRPGGWLQIVDRGEPPSSKFLREDLIRSHREQAAPTSLDVFDLAHREYSEPTDRGVSMVASPGLSGRMPKLNVLSMISTLARKPSQ